MGRVFDPGWAPLVEDRRCLFVVGVDPGVTTGWAVLRVDLAALLELGFSELALAGRRGGDLLAWRCGVFGGSEYAIVDKVVALCRGVWLAGDFAAGPDSDLMLLATESFRLRLLGSDDALLSPVRLNAILGYLGRDLPFPQVHHSPSDAKRVVTDERLRFWGLYEPGVLDHPRDAMRQAILTARKMVEAPFYVNALRQMPWLDEE